MNKINKQSNIKIIQYGCGKMGRLIMKYLHDKRAEIVGAIDNDPNLIGKDIGEIIGLEQKLGIIINSNPEEVFMKNSADVCIVAIGSLITKMYPLLSIPLKYGVNTITTCEEAVFPWNTSPEFAKRLDVLAKKNYCTLTASGYQDVFWGNLTTVLAGSSHKINAIEGTLNYNLEEYGLSRAESHGVGLTTADFDKKITQNNLLPSHLWNATEWLTARLGWTIKNINQKLTPLIAEQAIKSQSFNQPIEAGNCCGMTALINLETNEGPIIKIESNGRITDLSTINNSDWTIKGESDIKLHLEQSSTIKAACATIVNRLPELIVANPGYMTTHNWPSPSYRHQPLFNYLPIK